MTNTVPRDPHGFIVRVPLQLWEKFRKLAKDNDRKLNAELVRAIRQYVGAVPRDIKDVSSTHGPGGSNS